MVGSLTLGFLGRSILSKYVDDNTESMALGWASFYDKVHVLLAAVENRYIMTVRSKVRGILLSP